MILWKKVPYIMALNLFFMPDGHTKNPKVMILNHFCVHSHQLFLLDCLGLKYKQMTQETNILLQYFLVFGPKRAVNELLLAQISFRQKTPMENTMTREQIVGASGPTTPWRCMAQNFYAIQNMLFCSS